MLGSPELYSALQVGSGESKVEGQNHIPQSVGHIFDAAQNVIGFLGCKCTFLAHIQPFIQQHPQDLLLRAGFSPFLAQPVFGLRITLTQMEFLTLDLVEIHEDCTGTPPKPTGSIWIAFLPSRIWTTTYFSVSGKLLRVHSILFSCC